MPHYKDGQCAAVGDVVRGVGYNVPKKIVGTVVGLTLGESCNIRIAYLSVREVPLLSSPIANGTHWGEGDKKYELVPCVEYGEASAFELVEPVLIRAFVEANEELLRPIMLASRLRQLCLSGATYQLYRERDGDLVAFGHSETVDVREYDRFYCVPPATGA